mgnify:FL=1
MDQERRAALQLAKLRALVPTADAEGELLAFGPVVRDDAEAWTLVEDTTTMVGAVVWALRAGISRLQVVIEPSDTLDPGSIASSASLLVRPPITVWRASVDGLDEVVAPQPQPQTPVPVAPAEAEPLMAVLREHGVEPVVEEGSVTGEIAGLEVARIDLVSDPPELSVGVGQFDRDLNDMLAEMEGTDPAVQLATAARAVGQHRRPGAAPHPLHRLRRERWLRSAIVADPGIVGCARLVPVPPLPVDGLRAPSPAPALGESSNGDATLVVCSTGVDPALPLVAAQLRQRYAPDARLVLAVPEADDYPVTRELAGALGGVVEVRPLVAPWLGA